MQLNRYFTEIINFIGWPCLHNNKDLFVFLANESGYGY